MEPAPIGVFTYTRLNHLIKTIDALKANTLAQQSEIYIFSDGPRPGDETKVQELRDYLRTITGFKRVHLKLQPINNMFENIHNAHINLTATHGRSIVLEDDVVTSPHFLEFMNAGLDRYESNKKVFSIGGYSHPLTFPKNYAHDVFFSQIFCPWGVGIWKDRFDMIRQTIASWNPQFNKQLSDGLKYIGKDLSRRYKGLCRAGIKSTDLIAKLDMVATITMLQSQMLTVLPRQTMIENIGFDGSGIHCNVEDRRFAWAVDPDYCPSKFPDEAVINHNICRQVYLLSSFSKPPGSRIKKNLYLFLRYLNHKFST